MSAKHLWLALAFVIALGLALFGDKTPWDSASLVPVQPVQAFTNVKPAHAPHMRSAGVLPAGDGLHAVPLQSRTEWFASPRAEAARDVFLVRDFQAVQAPRPQSESRVPPLDFVVPASAPVSPSFSVLGKQFDGEQWAVYLKSGAGVWIVREGSSFDGHYAVDSIAPPTMSIRHRVTGATQGLDIGAVR